jgi:hypothetical protein
VCAYERIGVSAKKILGTGAARASDYSTRPFTINLTTFELLTFLACGCWQKFLLPPHQPHARGQLPTQLLMRKKLRAPLSEGS